jgi:hypothetical protein
VPLLAERPESLRELTAERDVSLFAPLREADGSAVVAPRDAQPGAVNVAPAQLDRLADAKARLGEELEEWPPRIGDLLEQTPELVLGQRLHPLAIGDVGCSGDADADDGIRANSAVLERGREEST